MLELKITGETVTELHKNVIDLAKAFVGEGWEPTEAPTTIDKRTVDAVKADISNTKLEEAPKHPKKRTAKKKAPAKVNTPKEEEKPSNDTTETPTVSANDVKMKVSNLIAAGKVAEIKALFKEKGYKNVSSIPEEDYESVISELAELED